MKPLLSCEAAADLDRDVQVRMKLPAGTLMEVAALRLWEVLAPLAEELGAGSSGPLTALCGAGNNAGDALALLRQAWFSGRRNLAVVLGRSSPGDLASLHLESLRALGVRILAWDSEEEECRLLMGQSRLLLDGIAGTGLRGPLRDPLASLVGAALASGAASAAVDIPSGLFEGWKQGDPLLPARWTLAIEPMKRLLFFPRLRGLCGKILRVSGVFPVDEPGRCETLLLEAGDLPDLVPPSAPDAHKGSRGRVAVFAGALGSTGAASMASQAALAAGAGLVSLFAAAEILPILSAKLDAVMVKPLPSEEELSSGPRWDAILAGPGWGTSDANRVLLMRLLALGKPTVLDADALSLYASLRDEGFVPKGLLILTPHPGELARLAGIEAEAALGNPPALLPAIAERCAALIIFKSHCTWIATPEGELSVWEGLESALATAGSGDVLAGVVAGLLGTAAAASRDALSVETAYKCARGAVICHGRAGHRARAANGWFQAPALIDEVGRILGSILPAEPGLH